MKKYLLVVSLLALSLIFGACSRVSSEPCGNLRTALTQVVEENLKLKAELTIAKSNAQAVSPERLKNLETKLFECQKTSETYLDLVEPDLNVDYLMNEKNPVEKRDAHAPAVYRYEQWALKAKGEKAYFQFLASHFPIGYGSISDWVRIQPLFVYCSKKLTTAEKKTWFAQIAKNWRYDLRPELQEREPKSLTYEWAEKQVGGAQNCGYQLNE